MKFRKGQQVEVCSKEEGFVGSYYEATIKKILNNKKSYKVQYKTLLNKRTSRRLMEKVSADEIQPLPPRPSLVRLISGFSRGDKVNVFDKDGWWVGEITDQERSYYNVYFHSTHDHIAYTVTRLRAHRDWVNGKWISY